MAAAAVLSLYALGPPEVVPAGAPATEFSAERAMEDLKIVAEVPRPVGSQGHAEARQYILQQIRAQGLRPRMQTTTAVEPLPEGGAAVAARVNNVLVRLPGTSDSQEAVLLSAHYDSWAGSTPGASDCGSCIVTLLETLRALKAGPPLKHDVIFLFTDAEERISLGAKGFVEDDPWTEDARFVLNFEGAGSHGPAMVLQTTEQNGRVVDGLLGAAPHPVVDSVLPFMFGKVAGGDDMEVYKQGLDAAGLDFVYFVDRSVYHDARDNLQTIDPRSVQHDGSYALALTRHFGDATLEDLKAPNQTFFTVLPGVTLHYPEGWTLPLSVLLALAFLGIVTLGVVRGRLGVGKLVLSILISLLVLLGSFAATTLLWVLVEALNPAYRQTLIFSTVVTYNGPIYLIAFAAFTVALTTSLYALLGGKLDWPNLAAGAMF
ncbi:MAG: M28 family peptidase [Actinomycetota bacterium]|nr:M28 family peptidase [Actinomycetota bacterium]